MSAEIAGVPGHDSARTAWPRWAAITLVAAGAVVIVAETTSYIVLVGILLAATGGYELVRAARSRAPVVTVSVME